MKSLAKLGYFNTEACTLLQESNFSTQSRPSYRVLFEELLQNFNKQKGTTVVDIRCLKNDPEILIRLGCCENLSTAKRLSDCIRHVGLDAEDAILTTCSSAFDVLCSRMEEKLTFAPDEQVVKSWFFCVALIFYLLYTNIWEDILGTWTLDLHGVS